MQINTCCVCVSQGSCTGLWLWRWAVRCPSPVRRRATALSWSSNSRCVCVCLYTHVRAFSSFCDIQKNSEAPTERPHTSHPYQTKCHTDNIHKWTLCDTIQWRDWYYPCSSAVPRQQWYLESDQREDQAREGGAGNTWGALGEYNGQKPDHLHIKITRNQQEMLHRKLKMCLVALHVN